jgi:hypothetical protein
LEILLSADHRAVAADRPRHQGKPQTGTLQKQALTLHTIRRKTMHRSGPSTDRPGPSTDRPASRADHPTIEKLENPEGDGFGKMHF